MTETESAIKYFENMRDGAAVVLDSGFGTHPGVLSPLRRSHGPAGAAEGGRLRLYISKSVVLPKRNFRYACGYDLYKRIQLFSVYIVCP